MKRLIKKQYNQHKETIHNFIWRSIQVFGKSLATLLIFILCAKLLTPYEFGIYNYALAIIFFLIIFGDFGISAATSKYVAEYNVTNKEKLKSVLFNSGIIILGLTVLIIILTLIIGPMYLQDKYVYVLWIMPLIFLAPMTSLYDGIYRGLKKFKQLAIISLIIGFISLFFVYFLIKQYGLIGALIAQNLFYLLLFVGLIFGYKEFHFRWDKTIINEIGKYSIILGITGISYFLYSKVDVLVLGQFGYITEIGYYETLNKIFEVLIIPFTIFGQIFAPNITEMYALQKYREVKNKFIKHLTFSLIFAIVISIIVYLTFPFLIKIYLEKQFTPQTIIMFNLLIWILPIRLVAGVVSQAYTNSTGNAHYSMWTLIIAGLANVILDIYFIIKFGFVGVVYSTLICYSFAIISFIILFYFKINKMITKEQKNENKKRY